MKISDKDLFLLDELCSKLSFDANSLDDIEFGTCNNCTNGEGNNNNGNNNGC